eukprot:3459945-Lingulodinium_polyedra.AAC.1
MGRRQARRCNLGAHVRRELDALRGVARGAGDRGPEGALQVPRHCLSTVSPHAILRRSGS